MKRKGLSQVLWLIIAAAVLMMVSMALTFTTNNVLGDFSSSADENQCKQTLSNKVSSHVEGDTFLAPSSCYSDDGNPVAYTGQLTQGSADTRDCIVKESTGWDAYDRASVEANCPAP